MCARLRPLSVLLPGQWNALLCEWNAVRCQYLDPVQIKVALHLHMPPSPTWLATDAHPLLHVRQGHTCLKLPPFLFVRLEIGAHFTSTGSVASRNFEPVAPGKFWENLQTSAHKCRVALLYAVLDRTISFSAQSFFCHTHLCHTL